MQKKTSEEIRKKRKSGRTDMLKSFVSVTVVLPTLDVLPRK